ncbi:MAG: acetyl-CoA decarbonylase/synthase complex subunit delta [Deltaproteobacteria bacterium]|nr:MAG: acetyl-CoA decarbonylase/synthase complex subunit delta [Deltaproteobacteria bacterium]
MAFEIPKQPYSGRIGETTIGSESAALTLGGEEAYPFHLFEGDMPNAPKIAMEVWDYDPSGEWPAAAVEPFKDVISSPDAWAKKCVDEYGADIIVLQMKSTDPNGMDRGADEAAQLAKKVIEAVEVPVVVWGTANNHKDEEVLKKISEQCQGKNVSLAPVEEGNHKGVGASAIGYGHTIVASSPIDVNLAKQLNILLGNLGVPTNKIVIDPTTGGLGYGLEYSYSVMERIRMAALTQEDDKLQAPMISNVGNEVWKCKEAGQPLEEVPTLGDPERRGVLMEAVAAVSYLLSGADVAILRHPESVRLTRSFIDRMMNGGMATDVPEISKNLELQEVDLVSLSPEPNLAIAEAAVPAKEKPAKPKKKEVKAAPKPEKKEEKPKVAPKPEEKVVELKPKEKAEAELKAKAEAELKAKAEAEAKAKAEAEAKVKAEEEAKKRAGEEARKRAEEEAKAKAEAKAKEKADLEALKAQMAKEKKKPKAKKAPEEEGIKPTEMELVDRLSLSLKRMHRHS